MVTYSRNGHYCHSDLIMGDVTDFPETCISSLYGVKNMEIYIDVRNNYIVCI